MSSAHDCVKSAVRKNIIEDLKDRQVTNLREERKKFYLLVTQLDPPTKMLSFCDNKYFPSSQKDYDNDFVSMDFKKFLHAAY